MVWVGRDLKDHLVPTPLPREFRSLLKNQTDVAGVDTGLGRARADLSLSPKEVMPSLHVWVR